jgi:hypothetical protein
VQVQSDGTVSAVGVGRAVAAFPVRGFVGLALLGLLFILTFPRAAAATAETVQKSWAASLGIGLAALVGLPWLAAFVFGLGLIVGGWWIGLMLLGTYALLLVLGYVAVAEWLGLAAFRIIGKHVHQIWAMLVGLVVLTVLALFPVLNALVVMAATVFGIGALVVSGWRACVRTRAETAAEPRQPLVPEMPPSAAPLSPAA